MSEAKTVAGSETLSPLLKEIDVLIRSRYPVLYLLTHEEARIEDQLLGLANRQNKKLLVWTATQGLVQRTGFGTVNNGKPVEDGLNDPIELLRAMRKHEHSAVYVLKDFHPFLDDPHVVRLVRDTAAAFKNSYKTLILLSPRLNLPPELEKEVTLIDVPLPTAAELGLLLKRVCAGLVEKDKNLVKLSAEDAQEIVRAAQGLTLSEAENAFAKAVVSDSVFCRKDVDLILSEKEQIIRKSGMLEFFRADSRLGDVGGLRSLKEWLKVRGRAFSPQAAQFGLPTPKGILLLGAPGCGKSLTAKAIAHAWKVPLLRMDLGRIFSGLVGSSEENMRKALKIAESVSPAVLWIDEIEKGLAGNGSGNSDSGVAARVFGTFLTWMQEKKSNVFVVATANSIAQLPPELLRRGRFDEIFFTDLPHAAGRQEILAIHLRKKNRKPENLDVAQVAARTEGFSGAELEHCVTEALFAAFHENRDLRTEDLLRAATETVPLSRVHAQALAELRKWAETRARPADAPASAAPAAGGLEIGSRKAG